MPAAHPREFRERAVALAREGVKPIAQVAKDLGVSDSCLRGWIARADIDAGTTPGAPTSAPNLSACAARSGPWHSRTKS